jgi:hypothetical protein
VLIYRALQLWIPAVLGAIAFVQLRETLRRESARGTVCQALADPLPGEPSVATTAGRRPEGAHAP